MARGRFISKSFSTSERRANLIAALGPPCPHCGSSPADYAQLLYMLLVTHADDFGREPGDAFTVRHVVEPLSAHGVEDVERAIVALDLVDLITAYHVDGGRRVLAIVDFDEHQTGLHKRTASRFPDPPEVPGDSRKLPDTPGHSRNARPVPGNSGSREEKRIRREEVRTSTTVRGRARDARRSPNLKQLTAIVLRDVLPLLKITTVPKSPDAWIDLVEAAKRRVAREHIPYDSTSIDKAIHAALARQRKNGGAHP